MSRINSSSIKASIEWKYSISKFSCVVFADVQRGLCFF